MCSEHPPTHKTDRVQLLVNGYNGHKGYKIKEVKKGS